MKVTVLRIVAAEDIPPAPHKWPDKPWAKRSAYRDVYEKLKDMPIGQWLECSHDSPAPQLVTSKLFTYFKTFKMKIEIKVRGDKFYIRKVVNAPSNLSVRSNRKLHGRGSERMASDAGEPPSPEGQI